MNELKITVKDWIVVAITGALLASSLSFFCFFAVGMDGFDGGLSGAIFGISVSLFAALLIPFMNKYVLPKAPTVLWNPLAAIFSFLSGFFGSLCAFWVVAVLGRSLPPVIAQNKIGISILVGINAYLIGALIYRFVKARNEKEELGKMLTKSRLSSLEAQLNSHFLFNALNSLAELIHIDSAKAEDMTLKLSSFLRAAMVEKPLIELSEEIESARRYIGLENIRFDGAIELSVDIAPECQKMLVPKFSVQLLCENGVKHGLTNEQNGLRIFIKAVATKSSLQITVSNDGKQVQNKDFGVGLCNLRERLQRLQNGTLELSDTKNVTYKITIQGVEG